jgi:hypothetical protein
MEVLVHLMCDCCLLPRQISFPMFRMRYPPVIRSDFKNFDPYYIYLMLKD